MCQSADIDPLTYLKKIKYGAIKKPCRHIVCPADWQLFDCFYNSEYM